MPHSSRAEPSQLTIFHLVQPVDGGVARVVTDLVRAQVAEGLRPVVACPSGGGLAESAAAAGARVRTWSAVRAPGPGLPKEVLTAARLIRGTGPQLIHAHSAKAGLVARLAVRGRVPTVFQPHAWSFDAVEGSVAGMALKWERYGTRWSTRTLCVSESERRAGERAGIAARWAVIPNGIDLGHFGSPGDAHDEDEETGRKRARLALPGAGDLPSDAPLVLCVGRLCRQKGQDVLLRAWPRVRELAPGARLVLAGDGPDREQLTGAAPGSVLFAGAVQDIRPWLRAADLVVLPSRWEGMALAPLEAMACGRPVVLSDVSGARESLPPGHEAHCLVPPDDPPALAAALGRLLQDAELRRTLGREAKAHTRATCDVRKTAAAVSGLYQDLLSSPRPSTRKRNTR
ncbi:glycosyltransferase family 4 protein [Streptomyces sp. AM8-1-1]|uniref:glycosyltransferase family 4 protein n=1 Tax=Streptomyces sp. AM8-1-1 TaxID=3075825 RepID=UPI0028C3B943|nr:glycosyltransferase family 4 protein [Streptomyces sp. AM8-1-1]WNO72624.1 glycosyltransferase family 4 protein [Streptomyces sp. AM8-1-1]